MLFYLESQSVVTDQLLTWPPLRVYNSATGVQWLKVSNLVYLEGQLNYTWLYWADGHRSLVPYTLKRIEAKLPPTCFIRLHRQFIVNRQFVARVESLPDGQQVYLTTGTGLPVSRRRWGRIRKQMQLSVKNTKMYRQTEATLPEATLRKSTSASIPRFSR